MNTKVTHKQTMAVCKHCFQHEGKPHLATCRYFLKDSPVKTLGDPAPDDPGDAPPPQGPGGGPDGPPPGGGGN